VKSSRRAAGNSSRSGQGKDEMLKDIIVHLATDIQDDTTIDYAISVALAFDAHLAGAAFANDEVPAALLVNGVPPLWIDEYRQQSRDAAEMAVARFETAVRRAGVSAQAGWLPESLAGAANLFARMARRFDLSVVRRAQARQGEASPRRRAQGDRCASRQAGERAVIPCDRDRGRLAGARRLRPLAIAGVRAGRCDAQRPRRGHNSRIDVALSVNLVRSLANMSLV
jgi:hypothetical protein